MTTSEYLRRQARDQWPAVKRRMWQRGFYDHIVRDEKDLQEIRAYIEGNPGGLFERFKGPPHRSAPTTPVVNTESKTD
jgi:hypothetical protein